MNDSIKQEFDNKISRLTKSNAYLNYCEEVYGYRMYLFNMMDKEQLDFVFKTIPLSSDNTVLDMGCGSGSILNELIKIRGCRCIGVDQLSTTAVTVENNKVTYLNADIDEIEKLNLHPTVTLLIDSIYFSSDKGRLINYLCSIDNNRVYLFYSQYLFENDLADKSILRADFTNIAQILKKLNVSYDKIDYSKNERKIYEKSLHILKEYKRIFADEGNYDLYEDKVKEQQLGKHLYDTGNASRYLYIIK